MSKQCNVCGYTCEDGNIYCPTCGSPLSETAPVEQPQVQPQYQQAPLQGQSQGQPQFQQAPFQGQPQGQPQYQQPPFQGQPQGQPQFQQAPFQGQPQGQLQYQQPPLQGQLQGQPQYQQPPLQGQPQGQPQYQQAPPKKSHKTLFIILGIVGGCIILLIILIIILVAIIRNSLGQTNIPGLPSGISSSYERYETDNHEYYFPDYDGADHNSEAYISNPTEASTEASTEAVPAPDTSAAPIRGNDLNILGQVTDEATGEPATESIGIGLNSSYTLTGPAACSMSPLQAGDSPTELNSESRYLQLSTGRNIVIGASANDFISAYGIDTTNAIWIMRNGDITDAYYYSTVSTPDFTAEQTQLVIGWYMANDAWVRFSPSELNDVLCNYIYPDGSSIVLYKVTVNSDYNIDAIQIDYGTPDNFPKPE